MPTFKYEGHLASGKAVTGEIVADTPEDASAMLRSNGVFVRKVDQGDVSLIYDHAPKPRGDIKVHSPDDAPSNKPASEAWPKREQPKAKEPKEEEKSDPLEEAFFKIEVARQSLKNLCASSTKKSKHSKCHKAKAAAWEAAMQKHIDQACSMALGMVIKDYISR
jgi:hypothetical protein